MLTKHETEFSKFKEIHDLYRQDPDKWQDKFNNEGKPILEIIQRWESQVCGKMEGSGRGIYSGGVADKFWQEVRAYLPLIDMVGAKRD